MFLPCETILHSPKFVGNARSLPPSSSIGVLGRLWPYSKMSENAEGLQCLYGVRLVSLIVVVHAGQDPSLRMSSRHLSYSKILDKAEAS